jgi:hypothetical protein
MREPTPRSEPGPHPSCPERGPEEGELRVLVKAASLAVLAEHSRWVIAPEERKRVLAVAAPRIRPRVRTSAHLGIGLRWASQVAQDQAEVVPAGEGVGVLGPEDPGSGVQGGAEFGLGLF